MSCEGLIVNRDNLRTNNQKMVRIALFQPMARCAMPVTVVEGARSSIGMTAETGRQSPRRIACSTGSHAPLGFARSGIIISGIGPVVVTMEIGAAGTEMIDTVSTRVL